MKHKLSNLEGDFERYGSVKKERFFALSIEEANKVGAIYSKHGSYLDNIPDTEIVQVHRIRILTETRTITEWETIDQKPIVYLANNLCPDGIFHDD
jgi:hypothetical protein